MADDTVKAPALEFLSDADVATYEGWLKFQAIDLATLTEEEAADVRAMFNDALKRRTTSRKVGRMKLKAKAGESKYAVAIREGADLWLAL
jgi:hypothetical protein